MFTYLLFTRQLSTINKEQFSHIQKIMFFNTCSAEILGPLTVTADDSHHAEGLFNPNRLNYKMDSDFRYLRSHGPGSNHVDVSAGSKLE
jgi:hypothetical protein